MSSSRKSPRAGVLLCLSALAGGAPRADTVTLDAVQDTMILGNAENFSNGSGHNVCVGRTGEPATRRGLFKFDVAGAIPAGSTINGVELRLYQIGAAANAGTSTFDLHRLLADWGQGGSNAPSGECRGTSAQLDDATWRYRFYDPGNVPGSPQWSILGGDYMAAPSATATVGTTVEFRTWTSAQMVSDVLDWLGDPATNFGWLLKRTSEAGDRTAVKFATREIAEVEERPELVIDFTAPGVSGACCFAGQICQILSAGACVAQGGVFQGLDTECTPNLCPPDPTGACCAENGTCSETTEMQCNADDGIYQGDDRACSTVECPVVLQPFVDPLPTPPLALPVSGTIGGIATYRIAAREIQQQLHRDLPPTTVWGYGAGPDGATYPGPTIEAASNLPVTVEWVNDLRDTAAPGEPKPLRADHYLTVDGLGPPPECTIHGAEDLAKTVQHLHGGHVEAAFDGYPEFTDLPGNESTYEYSNKQLPATLWYHDHALGITRLNVYMGLAGGYVLRDPFELSLDLPRLAFEKLLVVQDRSFNPDGSLKYPENWQDSFFGDKILVNGKVWPYLDVNRGKYRFRILNGSGSRTYTLGLDREDVSGDLNLPFHLIGTDGGLREEPLTVFELTLAPAERADVVIDFALVPPGTGIVLTNSAPAPFPGTPGVGVVPEVMRFVVQLPIGHTRPLPSELRPLEELKASTAVKTRDFVLDRENDACGLEWKINGLGWDDITEYPQLGTTELWRFINPRNMMHPMHMHLVMFQVVDRRPISFGLPSPPDPTEIGWKDTVQAPPNTITRVVARFEDYAGKFAYHCHILEHEDHEMMRQFWSVEAIGLAVAPGLLSWTAQVGATGYDVVRGDLVELRASGGNFASPAVTELCLAENQADTSVSDSSPIDVGQGFWYLVRARDAGGASTYDSGASSQSGLRDSKIASSGNDCP